MTPAFLTVARASATRRGAPLAEFTFPRRNLVAAITGAATGVQIVAITALRPLTFEYP